MKNTKNPKVCLAVLTFFLVFVSTVSAKIIYVDDNASGANDGSSWADAYNFLQDALADADDGDEIRVAQGTYKPDQGLGITSGDREATFQLINGVTLKGGYAGNSQPDPNARDIQLYETILSGDLASDDGLDFDNNGENSYHVVTGSDTNETAMLDGCVVTAGNANGPYANGIYYSDGGGMYNDNGNPTLNNCTFSENLASWHGGGGMYNNHANPSLTNCTFSRNEAYTGSGGGLYNSASNPILTNCMFRSNFGWNGGGGMCNDCSSPTLTNCTFRRNWVEFNGGGMSNYDSTPKLTNCTFTANDSSDGDGAGMFNDSSSPLLTKCTFSSNLSFWYGAGIHNCHESSPILTNCTFSGNLGWIGGGMLNSDSNATLTNCIFSTNMADLSGGGIENWGSSITLTNCAFTSNSGHGGALACNSWRQESPSNIDVTNCILWDGGDEIWNNDNSVISIAYSDVQNGWPGEGNIDADPCFVDPGCWDTNEVWIDGDYHLLTSSPCIDAGDPNYIAGPNETDLDGRPRVIGDRIDMGAYEYDSTAIQAEVDIDPNTLNLNSKGRWITAFIWLPEEYNVADIDPNSIFLENEIEPERFWLSEDNQIAIAKFNREQVQAILEAGDIELTITGQLTDDTPFEAKDIIKVIERGGKK